VEQTRSGDRASEVRDDPRGVIADMVKAPIGRQPDPDGRFRAQQEAGQQIRAGNPEVFS
jgi:hypothetical protein